MNVIIAILILSHGVEVNISTSGCVCITAMYDDGSPLEGDVEIFATGLKEPILSLETDESGKVCFPHPMTSVSKIVVDDGLGHGRVIHVKGKIGNMGEKVSQAGAAGVFMKAVAGAGIIWGTAGFVFYILALRKLRSKNAHS